MLDFLAPNHTYRLTFQIALIAVIGFFMARPEWGSAAESATLYDLTYSDLYLAQLPSAHRHRTDLSLQYVTSLNNPLYNVHGGELSAEYWLSESLLTGTHLAWMTSAPNALQEALSAQLAQHDMALQTPLPEGGAYLTFGLSPVHGLVNWFGGSVVPYDLVLGAGGGLTRYREIGLEPGARFSLDQRLELYRHAGMSLEYAVYMDRTQRHQLGAGVYVRL